MSDQTPEVDLIEFPCLFPVKAMGLQEQGFTDLVFQIIKNHAPEIGQKDMRTQESRNGKYISITIMIMASDRKQLDDIYHDLTACKDVLMAL